MNIAEIRAPMLGGHPLNAPEAARRLGVSESWLEKQRLGNDGPLLYCIASLDAWALAHRQRGVQ